MSETAVSLSQCIKHKAMSEVRMARYGCHKEVHALPLTRGAYNNARDWVIPENENPADEGYLVVYNRGTTDEYVSWSPKHIFDDGYHALDACGRQLDHIDRMIIEHNELMAKLVKLNQFVEGDKFKSLDSRARLLLSRQAAAMEDYVECLHQRLKDCGCILFTGANWPELVEKFGGGEVVGDQFVTPAGDSYAPGMWVK